MLRYMTAGESHGKALTAILTGMPKGIKISEAIINEQLKRRQGGYGRGKRMAIESDKVSILSGLRKGCTLGSPISLLIENKDKSLDKLAQLSSPRPGHADLAGMLKFNTHDARDILERASARETAIRVAVGSVCRQLLDLFRIDIFSHIKSLGHVKADVGDMPISKIKVISGKSALGCADISADKAMKIAITKAIATKDTLGGVFEIIAAGVPAGLGSCMHYEMKLDAQLAFEMVSVQAIKGISFGLGFDGVGLTGSQMHDPIMYKSKKFKRTSNNAGGIEGGMSNGEPIRLSCFMKPIATLVNPLQSINVVSKKATKASTERSDTCALTAAAVVGEGIVSIVLARAFLDKFGGDSLDELKRNYYGYLKQIKKF